MKTVAFSLYRLIQAKQTDELRAYLCSDYTRIKFRRKFQFVFLDIVWWSICVHWNSNVIVSQELDNLLKVQNWKYS